MRGQTNFLQDHLNYFIVLQHMSCILLLPYHLSSPFSVLTISLYWSCLLILSCDSPNPCYHWFAHWSLVGAAEGMQLKTVILSTPDSIPELVVQR